MCHCTAGPPGGSIPSTDHDRPIRPGLSISSSYQDQLAEELEGNGPVESAASRATNNKHEVQ